MLIFTVALTPPPVEPELLELEELELEELELLEELEELEDELEELLEELELLDELLPLQTTPPLPDWELQVFWPIQLWLFSQPHPEVF